MIHKFHEQAVGKLIYCPNFPSDRPNYYYYLDGVIALLGPSKSSLKGLEKFSKMAHLTRLEML